MYLVRIFAEEVCMSPRDLVMIIVSLVAMVAGAFLPQLAEPLSFMPRTSLMLILFLGFLSVGTEALITQARLVPWRIVWLTLARLFVLPAVAFVVFQLVMPEFALGALLVAGSCIGVVAPVFCIMVQADTALILVGCLTTSLLLPASLPLLLWGMGIGASCVGLPALAMPANFSLWGMTGSLCVTIFVPFLLAFCIRQRFPKLTVTILKNQFPVATLAIFLSTLAIFSQYSGVLHQSPALVVQAVAGACLLGGVMMVAGFAIPRRFPGPTRLACVVGFGTMNNVLMLIISMEFFTVHEALLAAMYLVPLNLLLFVYRPLAGRWHTA